MWQINMLLDMVPVHLIIHQWFRSRRFGLADDKVGSRIVKEHVVREAGVPGLDAMRSAEPSVADEVVATAIIVLGVVIGSDVVLL